MILTQYSELTDEKENTSTPCASRRQWSQSRGGFFDAQKICPSSRSRDNGVETIEALEHQSYDLVLMDIQMPKMNGLEATKIIRPRWHQNSKIIIITAYNNYHDAYIDGAQTILWLSLLWLKI
jgi:CheY-like chemotaxis protein